MRNRVAVLIPCLNEEKTIAKVVKSFKKSLPEAKIYVYDNNSSDKTARVAKKAGAIVVNELKRGKGNVVRKMFHDIEADCYLIVDGDDTYAADLAQLMCNMVLKDKKDMVIGDRLSSDYFEKNKSVFRGVGNRLVRFLVNRTFRSEVKDILTGYRAMSRNFVKKFPAESKHFEVEMEMTMYALANGFEIVQVPVKYRNRKKGSRSKINIVKDGRQILMEFLRGYRKYRRSIRK